MATPKIARLDVPLPVVEAAIAREQWLAERAARRAWLLAHPVEAEQEHQLDPADTAFARLACEHDDCCSTEADYPGWTPGGGR